VGRFWSLLFLSVPILGVAAFVFAVIPGGIFANHWLPEDISQHGAVIDKLFMFILYLTGVVFIVTSFLLFWFMWKYDADQLSICMDRIHWKSFGQLYRRQRYCLLRSFRWTRGLMPA
jgi:hypothetical protein